MNIHEYQAKEILAKYGVKVAKGFLATNGMEAEAATKKIGSNIWVIKAQIHSGGRGKAGGVKVVRTPDEARIETDKLIGQTLITAQTGAEGKVVHKVYVEEGTDIKQELYLSAVLDRDNKSVTFIASLEGGVEIEEIAHTNPEKIIKSFVKLGNGVQEYNIRQLTFGLGLEGEIAKQFGQLIRSLYNTFIDTDASQVEINPLVITEQGYLIALDAKMNFDDNALYRQPDIFAMRDELEEEPLEIEASKHHLNYIKMDGTIGCMVNGAGLAMATMDIIKLYGASPANFLDVGGGATKERVTEAFKIIVSDKNVKGILVNIFGGIMRCDIIAEGIVEAAKTLDLNIPLVVRLEGTNVELGKRILADSGLTIIPADDLADGAEKIVGATKCQY